MTLALFADIHSNFEAFEACREHARSRGAERVALLGDLVGYGADPGAVVDSAMRLAAEGAIVVKGNHDEAIEGGAAYLNESARAAIAWTRGVLSAEHKGFLATLPLCVRYEGQCFAHASAAYPERWDYIDGPGAAHKCVEAAGTTHTFCGHVHEQTLYFEGASGSMRAFNPIPGTAIPVGRHRRWLAMVGSVGQPRDGNPAASYAVFDGARAEITFHRVPYDHRAAARKIRRAGLPESLAYRMLRGI